MTMPAGTYYIGDLWYVMNEEWDEVCNNLDDGEHTLADGRGYAIYGTAHGDGCYPCSNGRTLGVDAGVIGCIKLEDIHDKVALERINELGTTHTFESPFDTGSEDGVIFFGHILVDTDPVCDIEEDDYYFDDTFEDELDEDYFGNTYEDDEE